MWNIWKGVQLDCKSETYENLGRVIKAYVSRLHFMPDRLSSVWTHPAHLAKFKIFVTIINPSSHKPQPISMVNMVNIGEYTLLLNFGNLPPKFTKFISQLNYVAIRHKQTLFSQLAKGQP